MRKERIDVYEESANKRGSWKGWADSGSWRKKMWKVHLSLISVSFSLLSIFSPSLFKEKNLFSKFTWWSVSHFHPFPWYLLGLKIDPLYPIMNSLPFSFSVPSTILFLSLSSCTGLLLAHRWIHQGYMHKICYTIVNYSPTQNSLLSNSLHSVDSVGEFAKRRELFKQLKEGERIYQRIEEWDGEKESKKKMGCCSFQFQ